MKTIRTTDYVEEYELRRSTGPKYQQTSIRSVSQERNARESDSGRYQERWKRDVVKGNRVSVPKQRREHGIGLEAEVDPGFGTRAEPKVSNTYQNVADSSRVETTRPWKKTKKQLREETWNVSREATWEDYGDLLREEEWGDPWEQPWESKKPVTKSDFKKKARNVSRGKTYEKSPQKKTEGDSSKLVFSAGRRKSRKQDKKNSKSAKNNKRTSTGIETYCCHLLPSIKPRLVELLLILERFCYCEINTASALQMVKI